MPVDARDTSRNNPTAEVAFAVAAIAAVLFIGALVDLESLRAPPTCEPCRVSCPDFSKAHAYAYMASVLLV